MSDRTLQALSIAFHSGMIEVDHDHERQLIPKRKTAPTIHVTDDVKTIMAAAKRVGQAFAEMSIVQLAAHLNIRF